MDDKQSHKFFEVYRRAMEKGDPVARYIKPIVGAVCVSIIDPFSGMPTDVMLIGNPADPDVDREDITVTCWTDYENEWFRSSNRLQLSKGHVAPYTEKIEQEISINEISDEEIKALLEQPYFAWNTRLEEFTSAVPVRRFLRIATEENRPVRTIEIIQDKLSRLQRGEDDNGDTQSN